MVDTDDVAGDVANRRQQHLRPCLFRLEEEEHIILVLTGPAGYQVISQWEPSWQSVE